MDNPEKLVIQATPDDDKQNTICATWTPLCSSKHNINKT